MRNKSTAFLIFSSFAVVAASLCTAKAFAVENSRRPNIVFLYADDWRWDCLGVVQRDEGDKARFPWLKTPRLDKLAQESMLFRQSFVVNSLCSPGRACVLTSQYSHMNGVISNRQPLPVDALNVAKQLKKAGYTTAYCGKFHMDNQHDRPGFDYVASFVGQGRYYDCPILLNGKQTPTHGWIDDVSTDYAIKFLRQQPKDKPFFLWLGYKSVHGPRGNQSLPERFHGLYEGKVSRDVPNSEVPAIFNRGNKEFAASFLSRKNRRLEAYRMYMRHITAMDECMGRLLDAIDNNGLAANTIVIAGSDNGYYLGEHELADKRSAYDESLRVPLLIRLPGESRAHGTTSDAIVLNIDYAPTILDFAGAPPLPEGQGRSLKPLLNGETPEDWRTAFFYEYFKEPRYTSPTVLAVRTNTSKLITYPGHDEWTEVFDLVHDPYEIKNLVGNEALLKQLRSVFDEQARAIKFRMPKLLSADEASQAKRGRQKRIAE